MLHLNIEIKAKTDNSDEIRNILKQNQAISKGTDYQKDTYFKVRNGRLKLREGNIENNLIHYARENTKGPKRSKVLLFKSDPDASLKEILTKALGVLIIVDKKREIYFINNVKFHLDNVKGLGQFVEIEAISTDSSITEGKLYAQCQYFLSLFNIQQNNLISVSYSDLLLQKKKHK